MTEPSIPEGELVYKNVGFGVVSYEYCNDDNLKIKNGKLLTETFDREGLSWDGEYWKYNGGLGMVTYLVSIDEVPMDQRSEII